MSGSSIARHSLIVTLLALLSGCGGGSPALLPSETLSTLANPPITPDAQHYGNDWMYTAQFYGNDLSVYQRRGYTLTLKRTISQYIASPGGMMATVNGFWYVTNGGHANVLVYRTKKKGPKGPVDTLDDYGEFPINVAATPDRNVVAVSNQSSASGGAGSVSIYLNRDTEPARVLTYGHDQLQGEGVAVDHQKNCFWSFNDPNTQSGSIVEFNGCNGSGKVVVSGIVNAGGIVFDQRDNLYYVNQTSTTAQANGIYVCQKTTNCGKAPMYGPFGQPVNLNFNYKAKSLWVADATGYIWGIDLRKNEIHRIPSVNGDPYGVAPEPGE